ncbi:MAG: DegT/DnrJ/EryC1/StrS family aminotransferase [Verrucomicrobia bacterium]|nr:DegT/DnrJ/EryC1/StrS family aminotransferase [Verrucomicrobiota bacterium]
MSEVIPFLDFHAAVHELRDEVDRAIQRVLDSGWFILGRELEAFEAEFAEYCGVRFCAGVANGLDAIRLLLEAHGIGRGDEVLVPSHTFIATWIAVTQVGAKPVPVDVSLTDYNLDVEKLSSSLTSRTRAVIPVHLYGLPCDMDRINAFADEHGLIVIEDNAQAVGALYRNRRTGNLTRHGAAISFYPGKNLGAFGDAGAITTNDPDIHHKVKTLRNYGSPKKYHTEIVGINSRLDEIQAAVLRAKLPHLDEWNQRRCRIAHQYQVGLSDLPQISLPDACHSSNRMSVWHLYVIQTSQRDSLQQFLEKNNIQTLVHYPIPPHASGAYKDTDFPQSATENAGYLSRRVLSLPIGPHQSPHQTDYIIGKIREWSAEQV